MTKDVVNPIRYAVAYLKTGGYMWGITNEPRPVTDGWYLLNFDEEGRQGILGGPCDTPEAALRAVEPPVTHAHGGETDHCLQCEIDAVNRSG